MTEQEEKKLKIKLRSECTIDEAYNLGVTAFIDSYVKNYESIGIPSPAIILWLDNIRTSLTIKT